MSTKVAINGFGRIGRLAFRQLMENRDHDLEVVAINDVAPLDNLAYLLRHDSVQTRPDEAITANDGKIQWGTNEVEFLSVKDPAELPWRDRGVCALPRVGRRSGNGTAPGRRDLKGGRHGSTG